MKTHKLLLGFFLILTLAFAFGCGEKVEEQVEDVPVEVEEAEEPEAQAPVEEEVVEPITETVVEKTPPEEVVTQEVEEEEEEPTASTLKIISLKDLNVYPEELTIEVGTTVEWRNINDKFNHIIGWRGQDVRPEPIVEGESWSYTFQKPGEYKWFSTARPTVQGIITVE